MVSWLPATTAYASPFINATTNGLCIPADNQDDCLALVKLWMNTGSKLPGWQVDGKTSMCVWDGVTCKNGRVTHLSLGAMGLTGAIPSEVGLMTSLGALWLYDNNLSGNVPTELGKLLSMHSLSIHNNGFGGIMPDAICNLIIIGNITPGNCDLSSIPFKCPLPSCASECLATCG